jgi:hypothetical protein
MGTCGGVSSLTSRIFGAASPWIYWDTVIRQRPGGGHSRYGGIRYRPGGDYVGGALEIDADAAAVCGEDRCGEIGDGESGGVAYGRDRSSYASQFEFRTVRGGHSRKYVGRRLAGEVAAAASREWFRDHLPKQHPLSGERSVARHLGFPQTCHLRQSSDCARSVLPQGCHQALPIR